jgi:tetratricopeptide (TPR) repeat protein
MIRIAAALMSLAAVSLLLPSTARAEEIAVPEPVTAERVQALATAAATGTPASRLDAAREIAALVGAPVEPLKQLLARTRSAPVADRRSVLHGIGASIPDKSGKFSNPKRKTQSQIAQEDGFDWLVELLELGSSDDAVVEAIVDVATVRALAASERSQAARVILDFAFDDEGMIYRDECGRYLRVMSPYSLPALVRSAAIVKKYSSERRYATYQLERMDLESPKKAVRAASGDEKLKAELLWSYGDSGYRAAVIEVLEFTNDDAPAIREAARKGFMKYLTTAPPEAPKRKLVKVGGELSKKEEALYLTYREIADIELRRKHEEIFGEAVARKTKLVDIANKLFDHWDANRAAAANQQIDAALALAAAGDVTAATQEFNRILALEDATTRGPELAQVYLLRAKELEKEGEFRAAAGVYGKVNALDPDGDGAQTALASHYYNLGKAVQKEGGDPQPLFARASEIEPTHSGAARALEQARGDHSGKKWMLYAGVGGGAFALLLLVLGLVARRH